MYTHCCNGPVVQHIFFLGPPARFKNNLFKFLKRHVVVSRRSQSAVVFWQSSASAVRSDRHTRRWCFELLRYRGIVFLIYYTRCEYSASKIHALFFNNSKNDDCSLVKRNSPTMSCYCPNWMNETPLEVPIDLNNQSDLLKVHAFYSTYDTLTDSMLTNRRLSQTTLSILCSRVDTDRPLR